LWKSSVFAQSLAVLGDVTDAGVAEEIVRLTLERFGRVDVVVNNAAFARSTRFPDLTAEEWREALEVNMTAPFLLTKAVIPAIQAQRYGRIINISSAGRMVSTLGDARYTASKAGTPRLHTRGSKGTWKIRCHRERHLNGPELNDTRREVQRW
jgi:NAD(P)-dependent dehydrogenase (short-subunit alcohol dehydrogenase family)